MLEKIKIRIKQNNNQKQKILFGYISRLAKRMFKTATSSTITALVVAGVFCSAMYVSATYPGTPFAPGEVTNNNPGCSPTDPNCYVTPLIPYTGATGDVDLGSNNLTTTGTITGDISSSETDPVFSIWDKSTGVSITESQISDLQSYLLNISGQDLSTANNSTSQFTTLADVAGVGYVTGTPWTGMGYVTGTPWTGLGYITFESDNLADVTGRGALTTATVQLQNATAVELGKEDTTMVAGKMKLWSDGTLASNDYSTTFTAGTQTANADYTLPAGLPNANRILQSDSSGVLTWVSQTGGMAYPGVGVAVSTGSAWDTSLATGTWLKIDQTTPQTIINGTPTFNAGLYSLGDVGIGTTTPGAKLDVRNAGDEYIGILQGSAPTGFTSVQLRNDLNDFGHALEIGLNGTAYATSEYGAAGELGFIGTTGNSPLSFMTNNTGRLFIQGTGEIGIGYPVPVPPITARLEIAGGTATAGTSSLKIDPGTLLTTPESGAIENDGTNLYYTDSTLARQTLASQGWVTGQGYLTSSAGLSLDQTTPQTVINGTPVFNEGITLNNSVVLTVGDPAFSAGPVQEDGAGPGYALHNDGNYFDWSVYAYKTTVDGTVYSATPLDLNATDDAGADSNYRWHLTWDAVPGATGYYILINQDDVNGYYGGNYITSVTNDAYYDGTGTSVGGSPSPTSPSTITNTGLTVNANSILNGNVGINTASPATALDVNGAVTIRGTNASATRSLQIVGTPFAGSGQGFRITDTASGGGDFSFITTDDGNGEGPGNFLFINENAPYPDNLTFGIAASGHVIVGPNFSDVGSANLQVNGTETITDTLGIGTTTPRGPLDLHKVGWFSATAATGIIYSSDQPADGDTIIITDADSTTVTFEFDTGDGVSGVNVPVIIGATKDDTLIALATAIGANLNITANFDGGDEGVHLTDNTSGAAGNVDMTFVSSVVSLNGMSGGVDASNSAVAAVGTISATVQPADGDTITITDADATTVTFEFDNGSGVTFGNIAVTIGASLDDTLVALATAIGANLNITANFDYGDEHTHLTDNTSGTAGNVNMTMVSGVVELSGMSGGVDAPNYDLYVDGPTGNLITAHNITTLSQLSVGTTDTTNTLTVSGGIDATNESHFYEGAYFDPAPGIYSAVKMSQDVNTDGSGTPFASGMDGIADLNSTTYAGYFNNNTTVSGTGVNYGIYVLGSNNYFSGNVGIGTAGPAAKLHVAGDTIIENGLTIGSDSVATTGSGELYLGPASGGKLTIGNGGGAPEVVFDGVTGVNYIDLGSFGIGTTSPSNILDVTGTPASGTPTAMIANTLGGTTQNNGLLVLAGNDTGVNASQMITFERPDLTVIGSISQNAAGTVAYNTGSDMRIKENITDTKYGLSDLMKIGVSDFSFINDSSHRQMTGFIAQDLENIFPDAVTTNGDNGTDSLKPGQAPWMVDYGRLSPLIVKSIQEQQLLLGDISTADGSSTLVADVQSETARDPIAIFNDKISASAKILTDFISARVTAIHGYFDEIFVKKAHVEQICVKKSDGTEACVNGDQLQTILSNDTPASVPAVETPADTVTPPADTTTPPADTVIPPADTVTPPADTVTPPADTTTPPADTVTPPAETPVE